MVFAETLRKGDRAMARNYDTAAYKKLLLHFMGESDPLYSMLQWLTERMMEVEAEIVVGAAKGKHSSDRTTHFSETRVRRFDTQMGTLYLLVPKVRQGGIRPLFRDGEETVGAGPGPGVAGGLHQRRVHPEDGPPGPVTGY